MKIPKKLKPQNWILANLGFIFVTVGIIGLTLPFITTGLVKDVSFIGGVADQQILPLSGSVTPAPSIDPDRPNVKNRLIIPSAGINMALYDGESENALYKGGWIFPGTPRPGVNGNSVIFGHRFRYLPPVSNTMYHLDKVKVGDEFEVTWQGVSYRYVVNEIKVIDPTDFSILEARGSGQTVTLITCAPLFSNKQRLAVIGTRL